METVVVQDSDKHVLDVLTEALEMEGFKVFTIKALDEKILQLISSVRPHVVIIDHKLDDELSIKICHLIRQVHPNLPVIAMSYSSNIHNDYVKDGFADYLSKPFDLDLLYTILRKHLPKDEAL